MSLTTRMTFCMSFILALALALNGFALWYFADLRGETLGHLGIIAACILVLGVLVAWLRARSIAGPLRHIQVALDAIRHGKSDFSLPKDRTDEFGQIAACCHDLSSMAQARSECVSTIAQGDLSHSITVRDGDQFGQSLANMIGAFRNTVGRIGNISSEINEGASQIASASQSLSQGATQQAASLEEIGASLRDIANTVKQNAASAGQGAQLADAARQAAGTGMERMRDLDQAMEAIDKATNEIAAIVKTIEEIAFQTNLLALNAAVEAARAGRHGKGFAVVAGEVRNLAGRAGKAAQEVAKLAQTAREKTKSGSEAAKRTDESLKTILDQADKVAQVVALIDQAAQGEVEALSQVTAGLGQIDQVTQQNAANSEETAAAAAEQAERARRLNSAISHFRLGEGFTVEQESDDDGNVHSAANIAWSDKFSVGFDHIDEEHKKLLAILNRLFDSMRLGKAGQVLASIVEELLDYTKTHFAHEEQFIRSKGYPRLNDHLKIHRNLEQQVQDIGQRLGQGGSLGVETLSFLKSWLVEHIMGCDQDYARFIKGQGGAQSRSSAPASRSTKAADVLIEWKPEFTVSVERFDKEHQRLIELINQMYKAMKEGHSADVLMPILQELITYTQNHFRAEEAMMKSRGYPGLGEHRRQHNDLEKQVTELAHRTQGGAALGMEVFSFLKSWLIKHILETDREYGRFYQKNG